MPQTVIRFGRPGLLAQTTRTSSPAFVLNHILGGGALLLAPVSRRCARSAASPIRSTRYLRRSTTPALLIGGTATRNERAAEIARVIRERDRAARRATGPTDEELAKAKSYLIGSYALRFDTSTKIAGQLVRIQLDDLGIDYIDRRNGLIAAVTLEDVRRAAARLLHGKLLVSAAGRPVGLVQPAGGGQGGSSLPTTGRNRRGGKHGPPRPGCPFGRRTAATGPIHGRVYLLSRGDRLEIAVGWKSLSSPARGEGRTERSRSFGMRIEGASMTMRGWQVACRLAPAMAVAVAVALAGCGTTGQIGETSGSGGTSFADRVGRMFATGASSPEPAPEDAGKAHYECPMVTVRTGAAAFQVFATTRDAGQQLRYQATFGQTARECAALGQMMTMKVGVEGRLLAGPAGAPARSTCHCASPWCTKAPRPRRCGRGSIWCRQMPTDARSRPSCRSRKT